VLPENVDAPPPGMMSPSQCSKSSGDRTCTTITFVPIESFCSAAWCSTNAPCKAVDRDKISFQR
jgi:hypothetical protein